MKLTKDNSFNIKQFNSDFQEKDNLETRTKSDMYNDSHNKLDILLPHQQSVESIILDIRDIIFLMIEKIENKQNPLPFIFSSDKRIFIFSLFLIIFGTLMLLLSSLMKSPINVDSK